LRAETDIDAPVEIVWAILADLAAYPQWCPFTVAINGKLALGEVLAETVEMTPGAAPLTQIVTVTDLVANSHVTWVGKKYSDCLIHAVRTRSAVRVLTTAGRTSSRTRSNGCPRLARPLPLTERDLDTGAKAIAAALKARAAAAFAAQAVHAPEPAAAEPRKRRSATSATHSRASLHMSRCMAAARRLPCTLTVLRLLPLLVAATAITAK